MRRLTPIRTLATTLLIALSLAAGQAFARPQPLQITVFVHKDVNYSVEKLYTDYLAHWEKEMRRISDREVIFDYVTDANAITTLNYQHDDEAVPMREISKLYRWHEEAHPKQGHGSLRKGLLVTSSGINGWVGGVAGVYGSVGIASLQTYTNAAHELGHMFGASHENSIGGWTSLCDSYMRPERNPLKAHCYTFSETNKDIIGEHLIQMP